MSPPEDSDIIENQELLSQASINPSPADTQLEMNSLLQLLQPIPSALSVPSPAPDVPLPSLRPQGFKVTPIDDQPKFCEECGFKHVCFYMVCPACGNLNREHVEN